MTNDTEKQIRERLEASGQFGQMRAMIVDAALQALRNDPASEVALFHPSASLTKTKATTEGAKGLAVVYDFIRRLGLQYTASVFAMETNMTAEDLQETGGVTLESLMNGSATAIATADGPSSITSPVNTRLDPSAAMHVAPSVAVQPTPVVQQEKPQNEQYSSDEAESNDEVEEHTTSGSEKAEESVDEVTSASSEGGAASSAAGSEQPEGGEDSTYYISKWRKRTFVRSGQVAGQQIQIEYLTDCSVMVLDPLDSMTADDCEGGELIIAACEGSVFLRNCKNMTVYVSCKQLRTRDCENVKLHIFTTTDPVVEMSHHMSFYPLNLRLPGLKQSFKDCRLDPTINRFVHVYDFTVDEPSLPQPHFTVHYPDHGLQMENRGESHGVPECPVEIEELLACRLLPAASSESGQNKSYNIRTGAQVWASAEAKEEESEDGTESEEGTDDNEKSEDEVEDVESTPSTPTAAAAVATTGRPPTAKTVAPPATPGGLDNEDYSSFDESSNESHDADDKYEIDEDDDDF